MLPVYIAVLFIQYHTFLRPQFGLPFEQPQEPNK